MDFANELAFPTRLRLRRYISGKLEHNLKLPTLARSYFLNSNQENTLLYTAYCTPILIGFDIYRIHSRVNDKFNVTIVAIIFESIVPHLST